MSFEPPPDAVPLGDGHYYVPVHGDRGVRVGIREWHRSARDGSWCVGYVTFRGDRPWVVESNQPLTISPSVLCDCGAHGWIRDGHWVDA